MGDINDVFKKELQAKYDEKLTESYKNKKMIELKDELSEKCNGINVAVGVRSLCPVMEMTMEKPDNWTSMNTLEKKHFIVDCFVKLDLIKVEVEDVSL